MSQATSDTSAAKPGSSGASGGISEGEGAKKSGFSGIKVGPLTRYLIIRFLLIIPTVLILVSMVFFLMRLTGDPITASVGGRLPPAQLAERIHSAGYDRPIIVQYMEYLGKLATGDFGRTITDNRLISDILVTYGTATLELAINSLIVAFLIGIPLGKLAARYRDRGLDAGLRVFAIMGYATPVFFAGLMLQLIFSVKLGVLPLSGRASTDVQISLESIEPGTGIYMLDALRTGRWDLISDVLAHSILPAVALGLLTGGVFLRLIRTNLIGTLGQDYVMAARSRGVREKRLLSKHAFKPALIPIITVMGMQIAMMLAGAVLTETTFQWRGLGFMLQQYLSARDFVAVQGIVALLAVIVAVTNFIVDVIAALVDPRVRY
ncbi:MAG: ABC transporter permease [Actinomycetaceae bacterium]|nr:ABC transporter permease [Actinomycetaceae bacterium]